MSDLIIANIEERLESSLRTSAVAHGRTVEEEARQILENALFAKATDPRIPSENLADAVRSLFAPLGGVALNLDWMRMQPNKREEPTFD